MAILFFHIYPFWRMSSSHQAYEYRAERIADITRTSRAEARRKLSEFDRAQAAFFKKVFGKKAASPYEFDLVINLDHFVNPGDVADVVTLAFQRKFDIAVPA